MLMMRSKVRSLDGLLMTRKKARTLADFGGAGRPRSAITEQAERDEAVETRIWNEARTRTPRGFGLEETAGDVAAPRRPC